MRQQSGQKLLTFSFKMEFTQQFGSHRWKTNCNSKPAHAGSHFHDCKGNESIIALVVAGPDYECPFIDDGTKLMAVIQMDMHGVDAH